MNTNLGKCVRLALFATFAATAACGGDDDDNALRSPLSPSPVGGPSSMAEAPMSGAQAQSGGYPMGSNGFTTPGRMAESGQSQCTAPATGQHWNQIRNRPRTGGVGIIRNRIEATFNGTDTLTRAGVCELARQHLGDSGPWCGATGHTADWEAAYAMLDQLASCRGTTSTQQDPPQPQQQQLNTQFGIYLEVGGRSVSTLQMEEGDNFGPTGAKLVLVKQPDVPAALHMCVDIAEWTTAGRTAGVDGTSSQSTTTKSCFAHDKFTLDPLAGRLHAKQRLIGSLDDDNLVSAGRRIAARPLYLDNRIKKLPGNQEAVIEVADDDIMWVYPRIDLATGTVQVRVDGEVDYTPRIFFRAAMRGPAWQRNQFPIADGQGFTVTMALANKPKASRMVSIFDFGATGISLDCDRGHGTLTISAWSEDGALDDNIEVNNGTFDACRL